MSGTTSVPSIAFTANGFVAPAESAIVTGLDADYNASFGGNLNTDAATPQGQLIASTAAILGDNNDQQVALYNGVDPAYASGRMQDAIARIYFLERNPAQSTVLQVACTGLAGVVIPVGATISDPTGALYLCTNAGIIGAGGTVTLPFASAVMAPIPVPAQVAIYQSIPNWNTVAVSSGVVGNLVEGRAAFEARRQATVAANGAGFLPAIAGAVAKVAGVIDYYATENFTGSPVTTGGVTLAAHSLYVCVSGGVAIDVATAIWTKKNPGCAYNGNTTETVYDTNSGYSPPYPSYSVTFQTPTAIPISFLVTMKSSASVPSNALALVQGAIAAAFNGQDGGTRARIGSEIFASRFYAGVASLGAWAQIVSILIGSDFTPTAGFTAAISGTTLTVSLNGATFTGTGSGTNLTTTAVTGVIRAGYVVAGSGVPAGTTIVSQTSGTPGGAGVYVTSGATTSSSASLTAKGTIAVGQFLYGAGVAPGTLITAGSGLSWTVAVSQTVGSEAMTAVGPALNDTTMQIDQIPTYAPADTNLVLA